MDILKSGEIIFRPYKTEDRASVRKICCDTAFMGQPMEMFFDDREILADILTLYYTDHEPQSCFVADYKGEVAGYLIGCKDTSLKEKLFSKVVLPRIIFSFIKKGLIFKKKTRQLLFSIAGSFFKGEFTRFRISKDYPADLHINIDKNFRRFGVGNRLMQIFFEYLKRNNVSGVHLATFSEAGKSFFLKTGFKLLWEGKTSQWRYLLNRDVKNYIFGIQLNRFSI